MVNERLQLVINTNVALTTGYQQMMMAWAAAYGHDLPIPEPEVLGTGKDGYPCLVHCLDCDVLWSIRLEACCWVCGGTNLVNSKKLKDKVE